MAIIVDTGAIAALLNDQDRDHDRVVAYTREHPETWIVPGPVVVETCIVVGDWLGGEAELGFLRSIAKNEMGVEPLGNTDLQRTIQILDQYRDARFGFVDAATMAIAERLKIETILTLDRHDFGVFRPKHCAAFRLVPEGIR